MRLVRLVAAITFVAGEAVTPADDHSHLVDDVDRIETLDVAGGLGFQG